MRLVYVKEFDFSLNEKKEFIRSPGDDKSWKGIRFKAYISVNENKVKFKTQEEKEIYFSCCNSLVINELQNAGYRVSLDFAGHILASLEHKKVSVTEIKKSVQNAGCDPCIYQIKRTLDPYAISVKPIA